MKMHVKNKPYSSSKTLEERISNAKEIRTSIFGVDGFWIPIDKDTVYLILSRKDVICFDMAEWDKDFHRIGDNFSTLYLQFYTKGE